MADLTTKLSKFLGVLQARDIAPVYQSSVTLTDAQIKALPTSSVEIVSAPGANRMNVLVQALLVPNFSVAYASVGNGSMSLRAGSTDVSNSVVNEIAGSITGLTALLTTTTNSGT